MKNVLITGAASGIGKAFAEHYLTQADHFVIAVDSQAIDLSKSARHTGVVDSQLMKIQCDFASEATIRAMGKQLDNMPIHLLVHSAGVRGLMPQTSTTETDTKHRETFEALDNAMLMRTFAVNTSGTFTLLQSIMPHLRLASSQGDLAKVFIMTSRMGSVSSNIAGGGYAYRASKAALNAVVRSFSIDVPEVLFALVHPGRVETGLVEFKEEGAMSVEESVREMLKLVDTLQPDDSGKFTDRFGTTIGW